MSGYLHTYQCSFCKSIATSGVKHQETRITCVLCRHWMRYLWSERITTDAQRDLAARGLVYNPNTPAKPYTKKPCATCQTHVERDQLIDLSGVGEFCSEACANVGVQKHQELMERLDRFYETHPWVPRQPEKETA